MTTAWEAARLKFRQVWGYDDFRPPQGEIVAHLLERRDTLVVLATGGGKSICFQLPALLQSGLTLVVSPLIALMVDQVQDLQRRRLPAACLHSSLSGAERRQILQGLGRLRLLYLSPETLLSRPVWERLCAPDLTIAGLMLDEAHCLVQWGDAFRPAYRRLGAVRTTLMQLKPPSHPRMAIAAFTATADPQVQQELLDCLQLEAPQVVLTSPYRANLSLHVAIAWTVAGRKDSIRKYLRDRRGQSGLIYARSRRDTGELATWLRGDSLSVAAYHAGLPPATRRAVEQDWLSGKLGCVVCTSAFGLGVNKPDCRFVLHYHAPLTLAEYIQEVGRAGRDGSAAAALMLVSEPTGLLDGSDRSRRDFFLQQQTQLQQRAQALIPHLPRRGNYAEVVKHQPDAAAALALLHAQKQLLWQTPFDFEIGERHLGLPPPDRRAIDTMSAYLHSRDCRWRFILEAFGVSPDSKNGVKWRCGHCDRCLAK